MKNAPFRIRLSATQRLLRCGLGAAVLMLTCFAGAVPRTTESIAESPIEATEDAIECVSRPRVSDPREHSGLGAASDHFCCGAMNPWSPTHCGSASLGKGHSLPNGLSAPLRC